MSNNDIKITTIPFSSLLGITFIILKLTNVINWSWIWVLAPFWIPALLIMCISTFIVLYCYFTLK